MEAAKEYRNRHIRVVNLEKMKDRTERVVYSIIIDSVEFDTSKTSIA